MKIIINKRNGENINLTDESDNINECKEQCTKILSCSNIVVIETTNDNLIIRPQDISSILISKPKSEEFVINDKYYAEKCNCKEEDIEEIILTPSEEFEIKDDKTKEMEQI